jgi:hypothetical protein
VPSISFSTQSVVRALAGACAAGLLLTTPALAGPEDPKAAPNATIGEAAAAAAAGAAAQAAPADDPVLEWLKKIEIAGLIDTYYTYNFNEPATGTFTPLHSFDVKHNQFSVALAELDFIKPATADDRVGFRVDLQYGQVAQVFNTDPLDNNNLVNVQQAYVSYLAPAGKGLTFEVGKWVTPVGTEPTESNLNFNYSRAFLYQYGPFYHVGARISYPVHEKVTLGAFFVNGWNATGDNNSGKTVGGTITLLPSPKLTVVQNVLFGPEQTDNADDKRLYSDTNLMFTSGKLSTGFNYIYGRDEVLGDTVNWQGIALYLKGQLTPYFALAPRFEFVDDPDGFVFAPVAQKLKEFTITAEVKHERGLITRFEYRRDWSDINFFEKNGVPKDNQNVFTVGFIVPFSSKAP